MKEFVEKLISKLEEESYWTQSTFDEDGYSNDDSEEVIDLHKAIEIINELAEEYSADTPQKSANGWIPCSERLPSEEGKYLVTVKNLRGYWILENNVFVCNYQFDDFIFQGWEDNEVIAWQPLPTPYRTEKEEWKDKIMKHFTNVE